MANNEKKKRPPGRPKELSEGKRGEVYLTAELWDKAKKLGEGNRSAGIRKALNDAI